MDAAMTRFDAIVIGGSAGALEPLLAVLRALDPLPTPVVVVLHLPPSQPSLLRPLIAHACPGRVTREPEDKEPLRPGAIYVAPPNYHLLVERGGTLSLSIDQPVNFSRPSIDVLFESAAHAFGAAVAAVVLSGSSADGARGLAAIADGGGAAVVQADAQYPLMPDEARRHAPSATALPAGEIAAHLTQLAQLAADRPARGPAP